MQSNSDGGVGLLGADGSRPTEEEKGEEVGEGGERASIPSLFQILPPSDHESQAWLSSRIKGEKSQIPLSYAHLYPLLCLFLMHRPRPPSHSGRRAGL